MKNKGRSYIRYLYFDTFEQVLYTRGILYFIYRYNM